MNDTVYDEHAIITTLSMNWNNAHYMIDEYGITVDFFTHSACKELFSVIVEILANEEIPHFSTIIRYAQSQEAKDLLWNANEWCVYGDELTVFAQACSRVRDHYRERRLRAKLGDIVRLEPEYGGMMHELGRVYDEEIHDGTSGDVKIKDVCKSFRDNYYAEDENHPKPLFNFLNAVMSYQGMTVVAARPGCGKTTFLLQEAAHQLSVGKRVAFVSVEMPAEQCLLRMVSNIGDLNGYRLSKRRLVGGEVERMESVVRDISSQPLFFAPDLCEIEQIKSWIEYAVKRHEVDMVFVDYLQLIQCKGKSGRVEEIEYVSNTFANLSKRTVPHIVAAQLNRETEGQNRPPKISDLKGSGAIEQDATAILLMHSPYEDKKTITANLGKNRHGQTTVHDLTSDFCCYRFRE